MWWNSSRTIQIPKWGCHQSFAFIMSVNLGDPAVATRLEKIPQFPRWVVPKNVLTIGQLYSSPILVRLCLKSCMLGFSVLQTKNFQMLKSGFRKGRGTRDQIANIRWIIEKGREFQKNIYPCFIDQAKAFDCVDHDKLWKSLRKMWIPDHLTCLLRNVYVGQEQQLEPCMNNWLVQDWEKSTPGLSAVTLFV